MPMLIQMGVRDDSKFELLKVELIDNNFKQFHSNDVHPDHGHINCITLEVETDRERELNKIWRNIFKP